MTEQEMRARSADKVKEVMALAQTLHLRLEARQRINTETGFIENVAFWIDDEQYPSTAPEGAATEATPAEEEATATGETSAPVDTSLQEP